MATRFMSICVVGLLLPLLQVRADEVVSFTLVNARTNADIQELTNGATIDLAKVGFDLNIRANTKPGKVGSVTFRYAGNSTTEGSAPYALASDTRGNYDSWTPNLGKRELVADK